MFPLGVDIGGTTVKAALWRSGRPEQVPVPMAGTRPAPQEVAGLLRAALAGLPRVSRIAVAHPAGWGPHRCAEFRAATDLDDVLLLPAPVAAVYHVAGRQPPEVVTAVLDLGASTGTAAVVRGTDSVPELVGDPYEMGIGGIDLDAVVREHVEQAVGAGRLDEEDATALHRDLVVAREALSRRTEVVVEVRLPGVRRDVELTRALLESLARPLVSRAAGVLAEAVDAAGIAPGDLSGVLLTGGATLMPLIAEVVTAELGLPVTVSAYAACLGAARSVSCEAAWTDPALRALPPVVVGVAAAPVVVARPPVPVAAPVRAVVPAPPPPPAQSSVTISTGGGESRIGAIVVVALVVLLIVILAYLSFHPRH